MSTPSGMNVKAVSHGMELRLDVAIDGLTSAVPASLTSLIVGKVSYTVADLVKKATEIQKPWKDARAAHAILRAVRETRERDLEVAREFLADLKAALSVVLGRDAQEFVRFGFSPRKRQAPLTSEQKVIRAAKAKLTREKRHTLGSRQRAGLRAEGTPSISIGPEGVEVTPPAVTPAVPIQPVAPPANPSTGVRIA